jgi:hypothetical protein
VITGIGLAILAIGCYAVSTLTLASSAVDFVLRVAPIALGFGISHSPTNSAVMGSVPRDRLGVASGANTIGRFLGRTAGVAALGGASTREQDLHVESAPASRIVQAQAYRGVDAQAKYRGQQFRGWIQVDGYIEPRFRQPIHNPGGRQAEPPPGGLVQRHQVDAVISQIATRYGRGFADDKRGLGPKSRN